MDGDAIWCLKWATNFPKNNQQSFLRILGLVHEDNFR
jgi:hypothetical protein